MILEIRVLAECFVMEVSSLFQLLEVVYNIQFMVPSSTFKTSISQSFSLSLWPLLLSSYHHIFFSNFTSLPPFALLYKHIFIIIWGLHR